MYGCTSASCIWMHNEREDQSLKEKQGLLVLVVLLWENSFSPLLAAWEKDDTQIHSSTLRDIGHRGRSLSSLPLSLSGYSFLTWRMRWLETWGSMVTFYAHINSYSPRVTQRTNEWHEIAQKKASVTVDRPWYKPPKVAALLSLSNFRLEKRDNFGMLPASLSLSRSFFYLQCFLSFKSLIIPREVKRVTSRERERERTKFTLLSWLESREQVLCVLVLSPKSLLQNACF